MTPEQMTTDQLVRLLLQAIGLATVGLLVQVAGAFVIGSFLRGSQPTDRRVKR